MGGGTEPIGKTYQFKVCDKLYAMSVGESIIVYPGTDCGGDCWCLFDKKYYDGDTFTLTQEIADTYLSGDEIYEAGGCR